VKSLRPAVPRPLSARVALCVTQTAAVYTLAKWLITDYSKGFWRMVSAERASQRVGVGCVWGGGAAGGAVPKRAQTCPNVPKRARRATPVPSRHGKVAAGVPVRRPRRAPLIVARTGRSRGAWGLSGALDPVLCVPQRRPPRRRRGGAAHGLDGACGRRGRARAPSVPGRVRPHGAGGSAGAARAQQPPSRLPARASRRQRVREAWREHRTERERDGHGANQDGTQHFAGAPPPPAGEALAAVWGICGEG